MPQLTISEVARQVGLRPSAIRYYEDMKVLPRAARVSGQRRYDMSTVYQLAVLRRAQEAGFTLEEVRKLFFGFGKSTGMSKRWNDVAESKIAELDARIEGLRAMKELLQRLQTQCTCATLEECGACIVRGGSSGGRNT